MELVRSEGRHATIEKRAGEHAIGKKRGKIVTHEKRGKTKPVKTRRGKTCYKAAVPPGKH